MNRPGLLLGGQSDERLLAGALDDRFEIVRLWAAPAPRALIFDCGADIVAALTTRMDAETLAMLPNLRVLAIPGAGYEHVDVAAARAQGVMVANAGDAHGADVADHAVAMTLSSVHRIPTNDGWVRDGGWSRNGSPERRHSMSAQRFGIVGLGKIGTAIAERLMPFGGEIAWWAPRAKDAAWPRRDSLLDLAEWCTTLVIATRGDATGLVGAEAIAAVGRSGLIVNIARGRVIDEAALKIALREGRLGRAALDVFEQEPTSPERWRDVPNVILSPHVAGVSYESIVRLRDAAIRNLSTALDGGHVVNALEAH